MKLLQERLFAFAANKLPIKCKFVKKEEGEQ